MNKISDRELEVLLESRAFVDSRGDLADRIIAAAQLQPSMHEETAVEWLHELFKDFVFIKPAYTVLFILALGLVAGFVGVQNRGIQSIDIYADQPQFFLHLREDFI